MLAVGGMVADGARGPMLRQEGDLIYGLEQSLPLFGKPGREREVAEREASVETTRTSMEFQYLRRDLAKQLFLLAFQEESLEIGRTDLIGRMRRTDIVSGFSSGSQVSSWNALNTSSTERPIASSSRQPVSSSAIGLM